MAPTRRPQSDAPTVVLHWGIVLTLVLSLATGLRIAADMPEADWARAVEDVLPQGDVIQWHLWAALVLLGFVAAYIGFIWRAGLLPRIALDRAWITDLTTGHREQRARAVNIAVYWMAFAAVGVAGVTGLIFYLAPGLVPSSPVMAVHQVAAWSIVVYVVVHLLALLAMGGIGHLLKILRPQPAYGIAAGIGLIAGIATAASFYGLEKASQTELVVRRITNLPTLDGRADDAVWQDLPQVSIPTARGANHPGGDVTVTVRAAHDGTHFFGLFQWPDTTRSQKHLPLKKTAQGWRVVQTEFGIQDEDSYYEDKFGVMLSDGSGIAGDGSVHLGKRPLDGKPGPSGGRGLHYTTDGGIVDVWHWKSVRTGNNVMQQIDDNYFGPPMKPKGKGRYTGGYTKDPKTAGGFKMNWKAYSDGIVQPLRLPRDPALLEPFQSVDLEPDASDRQSLFMSLEDTVPYDPTLDTYPVGTIMPGVLIDAPFAGDRGDVAAVAHWADGVWTMEVKRRLDTGSEFDVAFQEDHAVYLWVAVFDHAQTRHSQHLHPVRVTMR